MELWKKQYVTVARVSFDASLLFSSLSCLAFAVHLPKGSKRSKTKPKKKKKPQRIKGEEESLTGTLQH